MRVRLRPRSSRRQVSSDPSEQAPATEAVPSRFLDGEGRLVVTPQATGFDGAFAARLRRAA